MSRQISGVRQNTLVPPIGLVPKSFHGFRSIFPILAGFWLIVIASLTTRASASHDAPEVLHLKTYASASGKYQLEVDPSDIYGRGAGSYRLLLDGKEAWTTALPFTLFDAVVTDDGTAIGYAYQHGYDGFPKEGGYKAGAGELHVVMIDSKGGLRLNQVTRREHSLILHGSPDPRIKGILLNEEDGTVILRAHTEGEETWWIYRISDGKALSRSPVRGAEKVRENIRFVESEKSLPGLPLHLMFTVIHDYETNHYGALFFLMDHSGKCVWSHELPSDYMVKGDEEESKRLHQAAEEKGAVLSTANSGRFDLWFAADAQRVSFQVRRDESAPEGWRVTEIGRQHYQPAAGKIAVAKPAPPPLKPLGSFKLDSPASARSAQRIKWFDFDSEGRIGTLRWDTALARETFVLTDIAGNIIAEVPIQQLGKVERANACLAFVGKGKWIITVSDPKWKESSQAWWYDVEKKALSNPVTIDCPDIESITGTGYGGFVALGTRRPGFTVFEELQAFDADGKLRWKHGDAGYGSDPSDFLSPEDITLTRSGEVAVLDVIRGVVQFFDADGKYRRTVDMEKAWGRKPNYPTGIMADAEGGFIVHDFNGPQRFVRMKSDGSVERPIKPVYQDGREIDAEWVRLAPDGRYWTTDGHALLRLDQAGKVDFRLGEEPDSDTLGKIESLAGDGHDRLYALDAQTGSVHVFNSEGRKLHVCKPAPEDFPERLHSPTIRVDYEGGLYLNATSSPESASDSERYLYFSPDGKRQGFREVKFGEATSVSSKWQRQPGTGHFIALQYHTAVIMKPDGTVLKEIWRRPDCFWISYAADVAVAGDGSFAILSRASRGDSGVTPAIAIYAKDGMPLHTVPLDMEWAMLHGYNGTDAVLSSLDGVWIYNKNGCSVYKLPMIDQWGRQQIFLAREGRELWIVDVPARTVQRYAMP